ncbi:MAG: hypothetical protein V3T72_12705 [Thermoanaerobaculia bacterium]
MSFYKMVDDRVELARRLEALIEESAETTARAVAAFFAPLSELFSEEAWHEDELLRRRLLVRWVATLRREMVGAARAHRSETRRLDALRARRDEAVAATYSELVEIRRQARRLYGKRTPTVLGLRGRTHRKPYPLARQAGTAVYCLSEPLTESRASSGLEVRRQAWLEALEPLHDLLEPAIEAVARGKAATQVTLQTKDQAIKDFDKHFGNIGRYVQCAYRLVGLDELAARVPPREPRKSRRQTKARPARQAPSAPATDRTPLADVVDLGRWMKRRLLRIAIGSRRQQA